MRLSNYPSSHSQDWCQNEIWAFFLILNIFNFFIELITELLFFIYVFQGIFYLKACGILASQPRIEPAPLTLEDEVLTTRLPGKSLESKHSITFSRYSNPHTLSIYPRFKFTGLSLELKCWQGIYLAQTSSEDPKCLNWNLPIRKRSLPHFITIVLLIIDDSLQRHWECNLIHQNLIYQQFSPKVLLSRSSLSP